MLVCTWPIEADYSYQLALILGVLFFFKTLTKEYRGCFCPPYQALKGFLVCPMSMEQGVGRGSKDGFYYIISIFCVGGVNTFPSLGAFGEAKIVFTKNCLWDGAILVFSVCIA